VLLPVAARGALPRGPHFARSTLFFASLGFGFMFVEIPLLQRLAVYLGHPSYSTTVVLGSLPTRGRGETTLLLGIPVSFLTVDGLKHLVMPATNLALFNVALLIRLTRAGAHEALLQDYVKFARAKGLPNRRVIGVHVLRNILIPIVTVIGLQFGFLIGFAIVTESVFAWPGMGKLLIDSIGVLDRPVIVAYLLVIVTIVIVINLLVDVLYSALDPRIRLTEAKG